MNQFELSKEQYTGITGRLDAILAKMPAVPQLADPGLDDRHPDPCGYPDVIPCICASAQEDARPLTGAALAVGARRALETLLVVLDGWIEGQKANHEGLGHRGEVEHCWERWHPEDIRRMVEDAGREMGLTSPIGKS